MLQVVGDTPVDTGQARNNWITTLGSPDTSSVVYGPFGPGARGGLFAINKGVTLIKKSKPKEEVHLANNLPYIARLNDGYSKQAPVNFFQIALTRARRIIDRLVIKYKA